MTQVRATGLDAIIRGFDALPAEVAQDVADALKPVLRDLKGQLAIYPAERPNQKYRRTGTLGRGWTEAPEQYVVSPRGSVDVRIENTVDYTDRVMGDGQEALFTGRWTLASTVLTEYEDDIARAVEAGVVQALTRRGLLP